MPARRFPPPWSVEELSACYVARDHGGQALAFPIDRGNRFSQIAWPTAAKSAAIDNLFSDKTVI
jgi:hypothetical protein